MTPDRADADQAVLSEQRLAGQACRRGYTGALQGGGCHQAVPQTAVICGLACGFSGRLPSFAPHSPSGPELGSSRWASGRQQACSLLRLPVPYL
jgi:hypothetical protein